MGLAGDWLLDGTLEGAYLSGAALAGRVAEVHSPEVPADAALDPGPAGGGGLTHDDRWGRGPWPVLDAQPEAVRHRWNGRPVTGPKPRLVLRGPRGAAGGIGAGEDGCDGPGRNGGGIEVGPPEVGPPEVGRPVTSRAVEDEAAERLAGLSDQLCDSRPATRGVTADGYDHSVAGLRAAVECGRVAAAEGGLAVDSAETPRPARRKVAVGFADSVEFASGGGSGSSGPDLLRVDSRPGTGADCGREEWTV